ncbi:hypothetical protein A3C18_00965 [Candidatus Kaiserbacteria bacterium RIFCSPHIGHO2_02_FULL_54_11b]|uniref:Uncharacterized protein n=2 Tax=Candidatus Kaiseribacteriota TaxID=1752734 RepID=A0A1F6CHR5_9BACT|nr:MAG: hypothetical protein A2704_03270 [Candidatus Kaiserbacteria bacterium RIFCSPHIGHO2_01_FULL_54_36b]OGG64405.1 MAG: hypothetical protein A3C18_00965 [Candidatus Kaiserbacteria bacterium RIFCSPHIGHO2_02_FULL_54_11b]
MIEHFRKLPRIEPEPEDEDVAKKAVEDSEFVFNKGELRIHKRMQVPNVRSVPDIMGNVSEPDESAKAAKEWLKRNTPEEKGDPNATIE